MRHQMNFIRRSGIASNDEKYTCIFQRARSLHNAYNISASEKYACEKVAVLYNIAIGKTYSAVPRKLLKNKPVRFFRLFYA